MEASIALQLASVETQRAAIATQLGTARLAHHAFYAVPWTAPPARLQPLPPAEVTTAPACDPVPEAQIGPIVAEISAREGLTPDLLRAVIEKESAYLPCAVSSRGAEGLMQLMPETATLLGVVNPFDPRQNVGAGARFLKQMLDRYSGDLVLALAAYNAGPGRVDSAGGVPPFSETTGYITDILAKLGIE